MSGHEEQKDLSPPEKPDQAGIPDSGNLFDEPKLTALDPAESGERRSVERLLEHMTEDRSHGL